MVKCQPREWNDRFSGKMCSIKVLILAVLLSACIYQSDSLFSSDGYGESFFLPFLLGRMTCNSGGLFGNSGSCPTNWIKFHGHCYFFSNDRVQWFEAQQKCRAIHGALVEINSKKESDWITQQLIPRNTGNDTDWYIGANNAANINQFVWEFSQKTIPMPGNSKGFQFWAPSEPEMNRNETCVEIDPELNYMWDNDECDENEHYICERVAVC